jgi:hypothetical protein
MNQFCLNKPYSLTNLRIISYRSREEDYVIFRGKNLNGFNEGYCYLEYENGDQYRGFFKKGLKFGTGYWKKVDGVLI